MISQLLSRVISLGLGTLYPAYASYKAVRTKNVKEYVKWMMYWVVFALFTSVETFTDFFVAFWFPFYYELKIIILIWLLSPATKGSSLLYRKFVHPALLRREQRIDELISQAQVQSYRTLIDLGQRGMRYASSVVMESVMRAPSVMAEIVNSGQLVLDERPSRRERGQEWREEVDDGRVVPLPDNPAHLAHADIDMSDAEELPSSSVITAVIVEEEEDMFDLQEENVVRTRRPGKKPEDAAEALSFSSGEDVEEDPDFKPPPAKKKARGGKKKAATSTTTTPRKSKRKTTKTD